MTAVKCAANCEGYKYFGTQWSRECYCGNVAPPLEAAASECNMACSGDASQICGAGMRLSVYGPVRTATPPVDDHVNPASTGDGNRLTVYKKETEEGQEAHDPPASPQEMGAFKYQFCWTDAVGTRALSAKDERSTEMTMRGVLPFAMGTPSLAWSMRASATAATNSPVARCPPSRTATCAALEILRSGVAVPIG